MPVQNRRGPDAPHNLPSRLTSFVGREREIAEVGALARAHRLVTLAGAPGVGKTRLALQVAGTLVGQPGDGVWLVELAPLADPGLVPQAVADVLGVREQAGRPYTATLAEALRRRSLILVLDNCEHLIEAVAELAETLLRSCPELSIVATSREPLAIEGEVTWRVPSLTLPGPKSMRAGSVDPAAILDHSEAVRLFVDRARIADPSFALTSENGAAVGQICTRLDGIPLAVELAAARVRAISVEEIADRLDDRFRLLTGGSRTALPRHQTLSGAVAWSYELLAEHERALLRRFSIFAGGADLEAVEAVCDVACWDEPSAEPDVSDGSASVSDPPLLEPLTSLIDKSLVVVERGADRSTRYSMLEMVRRFGHERLEEAGETVVARRLHRACYLALAERAGPELWRPSSIAWLNRLEREHDNLRVALNLCAEEAADTPNGSGALALLSLASALSRFWFLRGHWEEGCRWVHQALAVPLAGIPASSRHLRARALMGAAELTRPQGDLPGAVALMSESLVLWRELGDEVGIATSLARLAHFWTFLGEYDRASALCDEGLPIARRTGSNRTLCALLIASGDLAFCRGDYASAFAAFKENLEVNRPHVDANAEGAMLQYAGIAARELGEFAQAEVWLTESVAVFTSLARNHGATVALRDLALVFRQQGNDDRAAALFGESLQMSAQLGARWNIYECLYELASIAAGRAQFSEAARLHGAAEALRGSMGTSLRIGQRERYDRYVQTVRASLGDADLDRALGEGHAMPREAAIELAMTVAQPGTVRPTTPKRSRQGGPLTRREQEVAIRVARGLTNRQIAEGLDLSQRTVDAHIRNMLGKLDLTSRAQLAVWSVERGLVSMR